ncbi:MAG: pyridoxamine 5'-phosphate oxidase, partial [Acidobacteriaceae bacterium]|nr:pyridoxamine 5'-phosphate oxidase [Acidobacteriaceae bacterium]
VSDTGFVFYTNYTSRKAKELETNPFCALTFWWDAVEKQVRVEGRAERISRERSDAYFRTRPKGSKLGAWASHQSEVLPSRQLLEEQLSKLEHRYAHTAEIPAPDFWGGYCVVPYTIEFWQGRPNRLHDRIRYRRSGESSWLIERLSP